MTSKIEQLLDEIDEYIDNCKSMPLSSGKIIVNKEEITALLAELRTHTPEEIKQLRKIISNKEAILKDAKDKAEELISAATIQTNQLISEHQIMQQAYAQADEVVACATRQAQSILDNATMEANTVRESAIGYTDEILEKIEGILGATLEANNAKYSDLQQSLDHFYGVVRSNREELRPQDDMYTEGDGGETAMLATGEIALDMI